MGIQLRAGQYRAGKYGGPVGLPSHILSAAQLKLWYDASSYDGSTWFNKADDSGLDIDPVATDSSVVVVADTNGDAVFIPAAQKIQNSYGDIPGTYIPSGSVVTAWWVGRYVTPTAFEKLVWNYDAAFGIRLSAGVLTLQSRGGKTVTDAAANSDYTDKSCVFKTTYDAGNFKAFANGALLGSVADTGTGADVVQIFFGDGTATDVYVNEYVCAVDATPSQIAQIDAYLNALWNLY